MLELKNLKKSYDRLLFENLSITFPEKGLFFIVGENGCGKSTLFNIILGSEAADEGEVIFDNKILKKYDFLEFRRKNVNCIFQNYGLIDYYSIEQTLRIPLMNTKNVYSKNDLKKFLNKVHLNKNLNETVKNLSGGEKQRLAIARALLLDKNILLCDEPTGSLDSVNTREVFELLKEISQESLVICVCHDEECIKKYADYIFDLPTKRLIKLRKTDSMRLKKSELIKIKSSFFDKTRISLLAFKHHKTRILIACISSLLIFLSTLISISLQYSINNNLDQKLTKNLQYNFLQVSISKDTSVSTGGLTLKKQSRPNYESIKEDLNDLDIKIEYCYDYLFVDSKVLKDKEEIMVSFIPLEEINNTYNYLDDLINNMAIDQVIVNSSAYNLLNNSFDLLINKSFKTGDDYNNITIDNFKFEMKMTVLKVVDEFSFFEQPIIYYSNKELKRFLNTIELKNASKLLNRRVSLLTRFTQLSLDNEIISSYCYNIWTHSNNLVDIYEKLLFLGYDINSYFMENRKNLQEIIGTIQVSFNIFLSISFVIAFLLIGIVFFSLVVDRKKEIALFRINGFDNKDIRRILVNDSNMLSVLTSCVLLIIEKPIFNFINIYIKKFFNLDNFLILPSTVFYTNDFMILMIILFIIIERLFTLVPISLFLKQKINFLVRDE